MLPELESDEVAEAAHTIRDACKQIRFDDADVVVLVSPHAVGSGVYQSITGSLEAFGITGISTQGREEGEMTDEFARLARLGLLRDQTDHGIVVASRLLEHGAPLVAAGFGEGDNVDRTREAARSLSRALQSLSSNRRVAVVASANGSAGLSARAPLTEMEGAREVEDRVRDAVERDLGRLASLAAAVSSLGGSCAQGPLEVLGSVFSGRAGRVLAHEAPVGVGYMVAAIDG